MGRKHKKHINFVPLPSLSQSNQVAVQREEFSGHIPHPSILEKYDQIVPGAANRILKMAEDQAAHRQKLEKTVIDSDKKKSERGQIFAFLLFCWD